MSDIASPSDAASTESAATSTPGLSASTSALAGGPDVPYEDKFVQVTGTHLVVKWLHVWESTSKFRLADIKELSPAVEFLAGDGNPGKLLSFSRRFLGVKLWGLSSIGILASPLHRPSRFMRSLALIQCDGATIEHTLGGFPPFPASQWVKNYSRGNWFHATEESLSHSFVTRVGTCISGKTGFTVENPAKFQAAYTEARQAAGLAAH